MDSEDIRRYVQSHLLHIASNPSQFENEIIHIVNYINLLGIPITVSSSTNTVLFDIKKIDADRMKSLYDFILVTKRSILQSYDHDGILKDMASSHNKHSNDQHNNYYSKVPISYKPPNDITHDDHITSCHQPDVGDAEYYSAMLKPTRLYHNISKRN